MEKRTGKTYLDFAATSYPKPPGVYAALDRFAREVGIGNDRGGYAEAAAASAAMASSREGIAALIGASPERIVFTSGATESLNTFLLGFLREGDHVLTSSFEHNAVRRPLEYLRRYRKVEVSVLPGSLESGIDPGEIRRLLRPETRCCVLTHVSNSFGLEFPVAEIGRILREREIVFALDAAQSLGTLPLDVADIGVDFLAFPGHKGLLGPTGTGGFFIRNGLEEKVLPLKFGGTGVRSAAGFFLADLPYKYEVGTQNTWGLAGLAEGASFVRERTVKAIHGHIAELTAAAANGMKRIEGVSLYLPKTGLPHGLVSFNLKNLPPRDTAALLDEGYGIKVRDGLHCSPDSHRAAGTYPGGTVRASFGIFTSSADVEYLLFALEEIAAQTA